MNIEDTLRDALRADAAELEPVGPGPDDARRRAFRRKRRMQSGVVALSAAALVGGTLGFIETRSPGHGAGPRVQAQPEPDVPAPDLAWRTVDGTVLVNGPEFTSASGVTYALSTAPGSKPNNSGIAEPQELYTSNDGVAWTHASLGATPWVADLAESNGVLYAVGTGPGSAGSIDYNVATSSDNGAHWRETPLPVDFTPPHASVPLTASRTVHIARGAHTTVAMANVNYWPDVTEVIGADTAYTATAAGVEILGKASCLKRTPITEQAASGANSDPCQQAVTSTRPWSDFGVTDPSALHQQQALVQDDGGSWTKVDLPSDADAWVQDVTATSNGFLMVKQVSLQTASGGRSETQLWSSSDGRSWARLASAVPPIDSVSISGDRIVGSDSTTRAIYASGDAGATWTATEDVRALLPSGSVVEPGMVSAYAGPLGYVAVITTGKDNPEGTYLLNSNRGTAWKVTDLGAVGAPAKGFVSSVSVGKDHIAVSFSVGNGTQPDGSTSSKLVELVGTPKA
jgi:hypothetical protein